MHEVMSKKVQKKLIRFNEIQKICHIYYKIIKLICP